MYPVEIIARRLCREDGLHPDGADGDDPARYWERYAGEAGEIIRELAEHGWSIEPTAVAS